MEEFRLPAMEKKIIIFSVFKCFYFEDKIVLTQMEIAVKSQTL